MKSKMMNLIDDRPEKEDYCDTIERILIPKYYPGQIVYAISFSNNSDRTDPHIETVDEWSKNYAKIYQVEITSIFIDKTGIEYWLSELKGKEREWGESVPEKHISTNVNELLGILKEKWKV